MGDRKFLQPGVLESCVPTTPGSPPTSLSWTHRTAQWHPNCTIRTTYRTELVILRCCCGSSSWAAAAARIFAAMARNLTEPRPRKSMHRVQSSCRSRSSRSCAAAAAAASTTAMPSLSRPRPRHANSRAPCTKNPLLRLQLLQCRCGCSGCCCPAGQSGCALCLRCKPGLLCGAPLLQLLLLPPLPLAGLAEVAERARQTILAALGMQERAWPATALPVRGRADARQLRGAQSRSWRRRRHYRRWRHIGRRAPGGLAS